MRGPVRRLQLSAVALGRNGGFPRPLGVESTRLPVGFDVRSEKKRKQV